MYQFLPWETPYGLGSYANFSNSFYGTSGIGYNWLVFPCCKWCLPKPAWHECSSTAPAFCQAQQLLTQYSQRPTTTLLTTASSWRCWPTYLSSCGLCYINQINCLLQIQLPVFNFSFITAVISHLPSHDPNWQVLQLNLAILLAMLLWSVIKQFIKHLFYIQMYCCLVSLKHTTKLWSL